MVSFTVPPNKPNRFARNSTTVETRDGDAAPLCSLLQTLNRESLIADSGESLATVR